MVVEGIRLNLGCGRNKMRGYINVDSVPDFQPELVHDINSPLPYPDCSVDEIVADGILEHFDKYARFIVFHDWARALKVGGRLNVGVPNFKKLLMRYFKFGFEKLVDNVFGENMLGSETYIGHWGMHKWGYSEKSLIEFVRYFGLEPVVVETKGLVLRVICEKRLHVSQEEIGKIEIYSTANDCGSGRPRMSLKDAQKKILDFHKTDR